MITTKQGLPLMQLEDGTLAAIESTWLRGSLLRAARVAGYNKWWLAEHVGASVVEYFSRQVEENVVPFDRIVGAVREVLVAIGYDDVATHYEPSPPPLRVPLDQIARKTGPGFELQFFQLLDKALDDAAKSTTQTLHLNGLRDCVKLLLGAKIWRRECEQLRGEIVEHVRERLRSANLDREVMFTMS
jgi:hypothetical protein